MRVELAGYNVDTAVLAQAAKLGVDRELLTPEPISAAYARISRYDKPVDELRRLARAEVAKARRSNQRIIWEMGHHSVAEHAVFNFDLIGVSRLAIEAIEHFRLCSFTEKSQRYITLDGDYVTPQELRDAGLDEGLHELVGQQNQLYQTIKAAIVEQRSAERPEQAATKGGRRLIEGEAKEDARYVTALATEGQLGLTLNARNLELAIRRLAAHELAEVRELGQRLYDEVVEVAPSLVLFVEPCARDQLTYPRLARLSTDAEPLEQEERVGLARWGAARSLDNGSVQLVDATEHADRRLVAALRHTVSGEPYGACYRRAAAMSEEQQRQWALAAMGNMELYDSVLREFEHVSCTFELVVSAACFGQLKRHRMASLTCQPYDPALGVTVPAAVRAVGLGEQATELAQRAEQLAERIASVHPAAAPYVLTNGHRRRVLLTLNARELYHVSRLREDRHAQWDIRMIAAEMVQQAKQLMPLTLLLSGGKDAYPALYEQHFGAPPAVVAPKLPGA